MLTTPEASSGPTVRRMLLGSQLRRLREAKGISREEAGYAIRSSGSKISRLELGRVSFKERDVADLLDLYGVKDESQVTALMDLAREANSRGWWHKYGDILPSWLQSYVGLEAAASLIRTYEVQIVPGLLQTEGYARAIALLAHAGSPSAEVERRVQLRMERQEMLTRPGAPRLWAVMDEAALRRPVGGPGVMRDQIKKLIEATEVPNVILQLIPFRFGGHTGAGGAFTILRFSDLDLPDIVFVEQLTSALYLDKREEVDRYVAAIERLCVDAAPPAKTADLLYEILNEV
jgi:transcriptional regulator with XRE-family HTH domain